MPDDNIPSGPNAELLGKFARVATRRRLAEEKNKALTSENQELAGTLKKLQADHDALKASADTTQVAKLQGEIRQRDYRSAFNAAATAAGAKPSHLDRMWKLAEVDTSKPEIDAVAIGEITTKLKSDVPEFFGDGSSTVVAEQQPSTVKPAPASGRGGQLVTGGPSIDEDAAANDPVYIMKNYDRIAEAYKAKQVL